MDIRDNEGCRGGVVIAASPPDLAAASWYLDPAHSLVEFQVPFYWGFGTIRGRFTRYAGTLDLRRRPAIELTVDAGSVVTGSAARDRRLIEDRFFDVARHPYLRFVSDSARLTGHTLAVGGELWARGRGIAIEFEATVQPRGGAYELSAETFVMHSGLGMTWNPLGITRPYSKLVVAGQLCESRPARTPAALRRPARDRCGALGDVPAGRLTR